jgi:hypothetical protein
MPACLTGWQLCLRPFPLEPHGGVRPGPDVLQCNHRRLEDTVRVGNVTAERYR